MKKWLYIARVLQSCASCAYLRKEMGEWNCHHPHFVMYDPFKRLIVTDDKLREQGGNMEIPEWCPLPNKEE